MGNYSAERTNDKSSDASTSGAGEMAYGLQPSAATAEQAYLARLARQAAEAAPVEAGEAAEPSASGMLTRNCVE